MRALLGRSALIKSLPEDEQVEACAMFIEKYEDMYNIYKRVTKPSRWLMEIIIDMHLSLDVKPEPELLSRLKDYLLKGLTYTKLDIYTHIPEYNQIVKLLRPEYYVEVDRSKFYLFTINKTIYKIATSKYKIKDRFENAYSDWYIKRLVSKGMTIEWYQVSHFFEAGHLPCVKYMHTLFGIEEYSLIKPCIKGNKLETFKYMLYKGYFYGQLIRDALYTNNYGFKEYVHPIKRIEEINLHYIIQHRRLDVFGRLLEITPRLFIQEVTPIISVDWKEAIRLVVQTLERNQYSYYISSEIVLYIHNNMRDEYTQDFIVNLALKYASDDFITIYEKEPTDLTKLTHISACRCDRTIARLIEDGYIVTEDDIIMSITQTMYWTYRQLIKHYKGDCILCRAISINDIEIINKTNEQRLRYTGCEKHR